MFINAKVVKDHDCDCMKLYTAIAALRNYGVMDLLHFIDVYVNVSI